MLRKYKFNWYQFHWGGREIQSFRTPATSRAPDWPQASSQTTSSTFTFTTLFIFFVIIVENFLIQHQTEYNPMKSNAIHFNPNCDEIIVAWFSCHTNLYLHRKQQKNWAFFSQCFPGEFQFNVCYANEK